jgi:hypothetical protein
MEPNDRSFERENGGSIELLTDVLNWLGKIRASIKYLDLISVNSRAA